MRVSSPGMEATHRRRRDRLRCEVRDAGAVLVTRGVNVRWLTGFTGSAGRLLVADGGREVLVTDGRYAEQAAVEAPGLEVVLDRTWEWLPDRLDPGARLAVESHDLPWDVARELAGLLGDDRVVPAPRVVETLRQRKDDDELALLRRACAVTGEAFTAMLGWLSPGQTERHVARRLADEMVVRGAEGPSFDIILAGGPHSARPHHRPTDRRLRRGELVKADFGALVDGYHADMTRTVALGDPGAQLRAVHDLVRGAQSAGVARVRAGVAAADVDAACRDLIAAGGRGEEFVHGTGHGVGLEIHEEPILRREATARLTDRMVVTVEPGVYLPGLGGVRIEDVVLVTPDGAELLTTAPTELIVL